MCADGRCDFIVQKLIEYSIGLGHPAGRRPQYEAGNFPTLPSTTTENVWCSTSTSLHHIMPDKIYVRKLPTGHA